MNKKYLKFSALQCAFWCTRVSFSTFAAVFFSSIGLSTSQIGFALSISTLFGIFGQLTLGYLADRKRCLKGMTIALNLAVMCIVLGFSMVKGYNTVLVMMACLGFVQMIIPSLLDTWILNSLAEKASDYSLIRQWGSLGYCVMSLFYGKIIDTFGVNIMFVFAVITGLTTITLIVFIKKPVPHVTVSKEKVILSETLRKLYTNKRYMFTLMVIFCMCLASSTSISMMPVITKELGGSDTLVGVVIFISVITEVVAFRLNGRLSSRLNPKQCFMFVCGIWVLQYVIILAFPNIVVYTIVVLLQGLASGFYIMTSRLYLAQITEPQIRSTAISYAEIPAVIASTTGVAIAGVLLENFGVRTMTLLLLAFICVAGTVLYTSIKKDMNIKDIEKLQSDVSVDASIKEEVNI